MWWRERGDGSCKQACGDSGVALCSGVLSAFFVVLILAKPWIGAVVILVSIVAGNAVHMTSFGRRWPWERAK